MIYALLSALFFGLADISGSKAARTSGPIPLLLFYQAVGVVVFAPIVLLNDDLVKISLGIQELAYTVACSLSLFLGLFCQLHAFARGSLSKVASLSASYFVISALISCTIIGEISFTAIFGILLSLTSTAFLCINRDTQNATARRISPSDLFSIFAAVFWGTGFFLFGELSTITGPEVAVLLVRTASLLCMLLVLIAIRNLTATVKSLSENHWPVASYVATNLAAVFLFGMGSSSVGGMTTSVIANFYLIVPVIYGYFILREAVSFMTLMMAAGIVLGGVITAVG